VHIDRLSAFDLRSLSPFRRSFPYFLSCKCPISWRSTILLRPLISNGKIKYWTCINCFFRINFMKYWVFFCRWYQFGEHMKKDTIYLQGDTVIKCPSLIAIYLISNLRNDCIIQWHLFSFSIDWSIELIRNLFHSVVNYLEERFILSFQINFIVRRWLIINQRKKIK